jgi:hypothetical protein
MAAVEPAGAEGKAAASDAERLCALHTAAYEARVAAYATTHYDTLLAKISTIVVDVDVPDPHTGAAIVVKTSTTDRKMTDALRARLVAGGFTVGDTWATYGNQCNCGVSRAKPDCDCGNDGYEDGWGGGVCRRECSSLHVQTHRATCQSLCPREFVVRWCPAALPK